MGFEPTGACTPNGFRDRHIRALCHLSPLLTQFKEEVPQELCALFLANPIVYLERMVQPLILHQIHQGNHSPGLGIVSPKNQGIQAGIDDGSGTHGTGLERNINACSSQAPPFEALCRSANCHNLCMGRRILQLFPAVMTPPHNLAVQTTTAPTGTSPAAKASLASAIASCIYFLCTAISPTSCCHVLIYHRYTD